MIDHFVLYVWLVLWILIYKPTYFCKALDLLNICDLFESDEWKINIPTGNNNKFSVHVYDAIRIAIINCKWNLLLQLVKLKSWQFFYLK